MLSYSVAPSARPTVCHHHVAGHTSRTALHPCAAVARTPVVRWGPGVRLQAAYKSSSSQPSCFPAWRACWHGMAGMAGMAWLAWQLAWQLCSSILEQAAAGEGHQPATRTQMGMVADAKETGVHERLGNFMASAETVLFMRGASPKCRAVTHKWIEHHSNALVRSWAHESETQLDGERLLVIRKPAGSAEHAAEDRFRGDTAIGVTAVARGGLGGAEDSRSDSSSDDDDSSSSSSSSSSREEEEQAKGRQLATATHPSHGYQRIKDLSAPCEEQRVHGLISQRKQARAARDFIAADALKQDLERLGVFVDDANGGTWWATRAAAPATAGDNIGARGNKRPFRAGASAGDTGGARGNKRPFRALRDRGGTEAVAAAGGPATPSAPNNIAGSSSAVIAEAGGLGAVTVLGGELALRAAKVSALKRRARAVGVEQQLLDEADDAEDVKAAVIALLLRAEAAKVVPLPPPPPPPVLAPPQFVVASSSGRCDESSSDSSSDDDDSSSSSSSSSREEEEQAKGRQLATATHPSHGYQRVKDLSAPCEEQRVHGLISQRKQARAARDFIAADALKQDLERLGVFVDDANGGTWWKVHGIGVDLGASAKQRQLSTNTNGRQAAAATAAVTTAAAALVPENDTVSHPIYRQQQQQQQQQEVGGVLEQLVAFLNNSSATTLTMHGATPKERAFTHKWIEHHPDEVRVLSMPWPGATHSRPWQPVVWY
jgi:hypothetical protein